MADYSALKATIDASINTNGQQAITGAILNDVLNEMVDVLGEGYTFLGVATISTNPTTPEGKAYYLAGAAGTYRDFGNIVVASDEVALLVWNGTAWSKVVSPAASKEEVEEVMLAVNEKGDKVFKTKADFVSMPYFVRKAVAAQPLGYSEGYEFFCIRAEGVSMIRATLFDTDNLQWAVAFVDANNNIIADNSVPSKNGVQEIVIDSLPEAKFILITNRIATGEGQFRLYYNYGYTSRAKDGESLYLGDLVNCDTNGGELVSSSLDAARVVSHSVCSFPKQEITITAHMPYGMDAYFWFTPTGGSASISAYSSALHDGESYSFPVTATHFRIVFRANGARLPKNVIETLINSGDIYFSYDIEEMDVVSRNIDKNVAVGAAKRNLTGLLDGMDSMFVFGHISDLHGDSVRFLNFADYCNHIGVDAVLNSGDSVMYKAKDYNSFTRNIMAKYPDIPYFFCIGNHESQPTGQATLFEDNISPLVDTYGYLKSQNTPADNCYYYKDFSDKKIRLIVINYYNNGVYAGSLGQSQIDWFVATLSSTPAGYGVLVMLHSPEDKVVAESPYDVFYQKVRVVTYQENGFYVGDRPIMHIIDAFISKATYNGTYTDNGESVTISADFSSVDATTEFIAYVVGHRHEDWIGYYNNATNKQLSLGITAGIGLYGHGSNPAFANQEDLPRGGEGVSQDAFNIYAIDRVHKLVKVVRIGANLTFDFQRREYMGIPYAD